MSSAPTPTGHHVDPSVVNEPSSSTTNGVHKDLLAESPSWRNALCVFCGSSDGNDPAFMTAAKQLGEALSKAEVPLVYGGGTNGLMGAVAQSTYASGGRVLGIMPKALMSVERPTQLDGKTQIASEVRRPVLVSQADESDRSILIPVATMHERKQEMAHYSELGFVALPGGYGTFEEVLEMTTWTQLGIHTKPVVLLNINDFYTPLRTFVQGAIRSGFIRPQNESFLVFVDPPSPNAGGEVDWGQAALDTVRAWHEKQDGAQYSLKWENTRAR